MRSRILKIPLDIIRHKGGGLDANNRYKDLPPDIIKNVLFSVQPFGGGTQQVILPDGINASDVRVLYSEDPILTANRKKKLKADRVEIDGYVYVAYKVANWALHGSKADHYESLFIREDVASQFKLEV